MDDNTPAVRTSRFRRWIIPIVVCALLTIGLGAWYLHGRTVWTDGSGARAAPETPFRQVVWTAPKLLEAPIVATAEEQQYEPALSPDGTELYFVRGKPGDGHAHIYASYRRDYQWTKPVLLEGVNGPVDDLSPRLSADGRFLLFSSNRPGGVGGFDIWVAPRVEGGKWGKPYNLGPAVNSEFNESNPDPTPDGKRLVFSTDRKAAGKEQIQAWRATIRQTVSTDYDLWFARLDDSAGDPAPTTAPATTRPAARAILFKDARELPGGINTSSVEGASCVSPVGDFLYFASNRPGGYGKFDLYRSRIMGNGEEFGPAENLGPAVNSASNETDPALMFGGFCLCFSSDRDNPRGVYALLRSDSREVFPIREEWPLPRFGLSAWLLLISTLLLIPLIMALRGTDMGRRLSILQKCLLLSLLVHAALTFVFSFVQVTQEVVHSLKRDRNKEVAVNLNLPTDVQIGLAVRNQLSSDLPSGDAPPVSISKAVLPSQVPPRDATPVKTAAPAADRAAVVTVDTAAPAPVSEKALPAPSVTAALEPALSPVAPMPDVLAPKALSLKVADPKSDATPTTSKPMTSLTRSASTPQPSAVPAPNAVADSVPKAAAPAADGANDVRPPQLQPAAIAADAPSAIPATPRALGTSAELAKLNPVSISSAAKLTAPTPTAAQSSAPDPTSSPLAAKASDSANSTAPAAIVATAALARPTTAPTESTMASMLAGQALDPARYRPADLKGVADAVTPSASPSAPASDLNAPLNPALAPVAAAVPRVSANGESPAAVRDALPAAARLGGSPTVPPIASSPASVAVGALGPVSSPTALAAPHVADLLTAPRPVPIAAPAASIQPEIALAPLPGPIDAGPAVVAAPFPRAPEVRKPRVEQLGGNKQSEAAVDRGLAYLARNQEADGRWTFIPADDDSSAVSNRRPRSFHDMGSTGLALLALLTRDNTPDKPGPYRNHVNKALNFLLAAQDENGDFRGPQRFRGAGSSRADMYDHAIATLALAEAAAMTGGDRRYADAAIRGAHFIVAAQDPESGGWRYVPGEFGDTSVFGWQIMALHACERLGFEIPARTRELADDWIHLATQGPRKMIAAYQPRRAPSPAMTAEMLYTRMLLGQKLDEQDIKEATDFLVQARPDVRQPNVYYWYYGSLCMLQVHNDLWKRWNAQTRDALIALQSRGGGADGSWNADPKYADRGGRIYMTSLALLTLEVYYRYERVPAP